MNALLRVALLLVLTGFLSKFASELSFNPSLNDTSVQPLPDIIHQTFPNFCDQRGVGLNCPRWLVPFANAGPDKALLVNISILALTLLGLPLYPNAIRLLTEFCGLYSILILVRCITIVVTQVPSPAPMCRGIKSLDELPLEGWFLAQVYCQALMYSGHTVGNTLCWCFIVVSRHSFRVKLGASLWAVFSLFWSVVLKDHYTSDVVVGAFFTAALFSGRAEIVRHHFGRRISVKRILDHCISVLLAIVLAMISPVALLFSEARKRIYDSPKERFKIIRTPESAFENVNKTLFPFHPNYVKIKGAAPAEFRIHYIDERPSDPKIKGTILLLHGEPSWSFLYRDFVKPLVGAQYRIVAFDFAGFGKSDKFTAMDDYTHDLHQKTLIELVETLDLKEITVVCQDWGGLTGLSCLEKMNDRVRSVVAMNTGLPTGLDVYNAVRGIPFLLWRCLNMIVGQHLPVKIIFAASFPYESAAILEGYASPFPSSEYKAGAAKWPLLVPIFKEMDVAQSMRETRAFLKSFDKPTLIAFSDKDPITRGANADLKQLIRGSRHYPEQTIHGGGHFLQETHSAVIAKHIIEFLRKTE